MILAIDIGGTKIAAALFDSAGVMQPARQVASVVHHNLASLVSYLAESFARELALAEVVSIACTGLVGKDKVNFLSVKQSVALQAQLSTLIAKPVFIANDASAAAWAEYQHLRRQRVLPSDSMVYITVSTGVGGGVVQNGRLVTSDHGFCAHLGHVSVVLANSVQVPCHCGRVNCVEAIASGSAIARHASSLIGSSVSTQAVFEQYADVCQPVIHAAQQAIAEMIASVSVITGAQVFVLGGSVGRRADFISGIKAYLSQLPAPYSIEVVCSVCGADADLVGAYLLAVASRGLQ